MGRLLVSSGRTASPSTRAGPRVPLFPIECDSASVDEPPTDLRAPRSGTYAAVYVAHHGLPPHGYRFTVTLAR